MSNNIGSYLLGHKILLNTEKILLVKKQKKHNTKYFNICCLAGYNEWTHVL